MQYDSMDECEYCVQTCWRPWLRELLDIEGIAKQEETSATFNARDATTKSERDLALRRREVAAEAILTIRAAKIAVMDALDAIDAEKAQRYSIDKEKYDIHIPRSLDDTHYKEKIKKAVEAKKTQEIRFDLMNAWSKKWALRIAKIAKCADMYASRDHPSIRVIKKRTDSKDDDDMNESDLKDTSSIDSETSFKNKLKPNQSRPYQKGGLSKKDTASHSKEKLPGSKKGSPKGTHSKDSSKKSPGLSSENLGTAAADKDKNAIDKKGTPSAKEKKDLPTEDKKVDEKGTAEKKEPGAKPGNEKVTTEKKEAAGTSANNTTEKTETASASAKTTTEKPNVEKKEPASAPSPAKSTPDKKDSPDANTSDKKK